MKSPSSLFKRALAAATAATLALGVAACSSSSTGTSTNSGGGGAVESTSIVLGIQTQTNQTKPYTTMVAEFMKQNPTIKVEIVETPNENFGSIIKTQFQAGNAPDVIYGSPGSGNANSLLPYAKAGYLMSLTDKDWATAAIPESAKGLYYQDDQLWALPTDIAPITWDINQTVFDDLKIAYPTTFAEVLDACKVATAAGKPLIQLAGALVPNAGIMSLEIAGSRVYSQDPDWNTKRTDGSVKFATSQGWKDTLQTVLDLQDGGCFQQGAEAGTFDDLFSTVAAGGAASLFAPAGVVADLAALNSTPKYTVIPFPGVAASDTFVFASPSNALGINKATKNPDAALKLLEFFAAPDQQDAMVKLTGNASLRAVLKGGDVGAEFDNIKTYLTDPKKNAPLANLFWPNGEVYNQLGQGVQGLLTGQANIDQVLQAMDEAWDAGS